MKLARNPPLAVRLFRRVLLLVSLIGIVMASVAFWAAHEQIYREADAELVTAANVLYALTQRQLNDRPQGGQLLSVDESLLSGEELHSFERSADRRMFAITSGSHPLLRSDTGPPARLLPDGPGLTTIAAGDGPWRIYGLAVPSEHILIQVGEHLALRDALLVNIARNMMIPLVVLVVGSGFLLWLALQDGLLQLRQLSEVLARRSPRDTARLQELDCPSDLLPLVSTLNALFARVEQAFALERQFTDNAAHQLRTPLAALRLQVQTMALTEDPESRTACGVASLAAVDRTSLLIDQMLALARLDAGEMKLEALDFVAILSQCIADHVGAADQVDITIAYEGPSKAIRKADGTALGLIFSNLIDNAVKYSPSGTTIQVSLAAHPDHRLVVTIADDGPGIDAEERANVLRRFHRGTSEQSGFGLGLAIVSSAVRLLGASFTLSDRAPAAGLLASVTWLH
ncbi:ATP-binding protein [Rhizorhabdus argentea]|uniref:ATP-binding protein n=1 Tax=Rhizorhabdus argentea TaxID=1387174 RepID=UPI0030EE3823